MRAVLALFLLLIGAATMNASAHSMWVESKDVADVGDTQSVYSFWGHLDDPTGITAPSSEANNLVTPDGQRLDLAMDQGKWLPAYGWIGYAFSDVTLYWPGDYVFLVSRNPSVYDAAWHGSGPSNPRLGHSYAKAVIHVGNESQGSWDAGVPLEINPEKAPYEIKVEENVTFQAKYNGQPVNVTYLAFPLNSASETQTGSSGDQGSFTVSFSQGGLWQVSANYDLQEPGKWIATSESAGHYKIGDEVPYNVTRYSSIMSIWVRP